MIRLMLAALLLSGCASVDHIKTFPLIEVDDAGYVLFGVRLKF